MKRLIFVPVVALVFGILAPTTASFADGTQVTLACDDGTSLTALVDPATLDEMTQAVEGMIEDPAGLSCSVTQNVTLSGPMAAAMQRLSASALADDNGNDDFAVGGGRFPNPFFGCEENFAINTHAPNDVTAADTANGTGNVSLPAGAGCTLFGVPTTGSLVTKSDCQKVTGKTAQFTAEVTQSTGAFFALGIMPGDEFSWEVKDLDPMKDEINGEDIGKHTTANECVFATFATDQIDHGNILVVDQ